MRILFASTASHPRMGGQGVYVREVSRALAELGHAVTVVSGPPYPEVFPGIVLERLPALAIPPERSAIKAFQPSSLGSWPDLAEWGLHALGRFGEPFAFGERLKAWLSTRCDGFDVIHDNQGLYSALPHLGLPTMATLHHPITVDLKFALETEPSLERRRALERRHGFLAMQARVARALPAILTVSEASKARIVSDFGVDPTHIRVSPCGVNHETFKLRPEIARDPSLVVSAVSSDVPHKGLVLLIEAMAAVVRGRPQARLQIVGELRDGPAKTAIARLGLEPFVIHGGRLSPPEMAELFARAAVVVSPSLFEGFGLPSAEAMACGAAVVVTDGGAPPEVVGDAGLVAPAGQTAPLAAAISRLLGDEALRRDLGARGVARARALTWRSHAAAAVACYAEAGARQT
jgi:glycosyltransferase involved in cell wall biosynthesis